QAEKTVHGAQRTAPGRIPNNTTHPPAFAQPPRQEAHYTENLFLGAAVTTINMSQAANSSSRRGGEAGISSSNQHANRRSGPLVYSNSLLSSPPSSSRLRGPSANVSSAIPQHTPARKNPVQEKNVEISIEPD